MRNLIKFIKRLWCKHFTVYTKPDIFTCIDLGQNILVTCKTCGKTGTHTAQSILFDLTLELP